MVLHTPKWKIFKYLADKVDNLLIGNVELEKLVISKSLKENYKSTNLPHVAVSKKMKERGKYVSTGTRIRYVFTVCDNKKAAQYIKAEDPDYLKQDEKIKIDYLYYLEKQLINPIDEVLEVKFKTKNVLENFFKLIKKEKIKTAAEYFKPNFKLQV